MRVLIIGSGYVGLSMGVILAETHDVLLLDIDSSKVESINNGNSPIFEEGITELLQTAIQSGRLKAQTPDSPIGQRDVIMICVGTPSRDDGSVDLSYVDSALSSLFERTDEFCDGFAAVGIKSTVPPGTTRKLVLNKIDNGGFNDKIGGVRLQDPENNVRVRVPVVGIADHLFNGVGKFGFR